MYDANGIGTDAYKVCRNEEEDDVSESSSDEWNREASRENPTRADEKTPKR